MDGGFRCAKCGSEGDPVDAIPPAFRVLKMYRRFPDGTVSSVYTTTSATMVFEPGENDIYLCSACAGQMPQTANVVVD